MWDYPVVLKSVWTLKCASAASGLFGELNTAGVQERCQGKVYPIQDPSSQTKLDHWSFLLGGFLGMLRDILTSKCLTFFITQALCLHHCGALFPLLPLSASTNEKLFNLSFFKPWVNFKIQPMSCYCSHGNDWTVCLISLVKERTKPYCSNI